MTTASSAADHHPIVAHPCTPASNDGEFWSDFLGVRTRVSFYPYPDGSWFSPVFNEEYFEWIDLLEALHEAEDEFVMVELGAGYGRWSIRAAAAAARKPGCRCRCVAIEAEPVHFRWMRQHFRDNDVRPGDHDLTWAAVGTSPGFVPFWVGDPQNWYGQATASRTDDGFPDLRTRRSLKARSVLGRPPEVARGGRSVVWVPCVTLPDLISAYPRIDLMDLDIQGLEFEVLAANIELLTTRVRRIHIGTHSLQVEDGLRSLFASATWQGIHDYPCGSRVTTPYGDISFGDGVQSWLNPSLRRGVKSV